MNKIKRRIKEMELAPKNKLEGILNGENVAPKNRLEYFIKKAMSRSSNDYKVEVTTDGQTKSFTVDKSIADIFAAAEADKHVYAKVTVLMGGLTMYQRFEITTWIAAMGNYTVTFGAVQEDENAANPVCIMGENTGGADTWTVI